MLLLKRVSKYVSTQNLVYFDSIFLKKNEKNDFFFIPKNFQKSIFQAKTKVGILIFFCVYAFLRLFRKFCRKKIKKNAFVLVKNRFFSFFAFFFYFFLMLYILNEVFCL